jgi:magnesium-transporting ATPase (P-type)
MTKGPIEDVIPNCDANLLPKDFSQIISFYRRNGYDMLIMASKIINKNDYDDSLDEDYYMNNLIFCGIITYKNRLKNEAKQVIPKLKKLNCDIILNTGDNLYNALSASFETGIISTKNVFVFDFDTINKKIILNNYTEVMKIEQSKTFLEKTPTNNFIQQRQTKNNLYSTNKLNAFIHKLERFDLSMGKSDSHHNLESNKDSNLIFDSSLNITSNKNLFFKKIANLNFDNHKNKSHHNKDIDSSKESFKFKRPIGKKIDLKVYNLQNSKNLFEGADILKESMRKNLITKIGNNSKRPLLGFLDKIKGRNKRGSISSDKNINNFKNQKQQFGNSFLYKRSPTKTIPVKIAKTDNE